MRISRNREGGFIGNGNIRGQGTPHRLRGIAETGRPVGRPGGLATVAGVKVLVVSDAQWVRNQVRAALSGSSEIVEVTDPYKAEPVAAAEHADAVIVDMQVGSMGGMALTRALKGVPPGNTPIVLLLDRRVDEFIARRAAADAWLLKPFSTQDLRSVLATVLPVGADR